MAMQHAQDTDRSLRKLAGLGVLVAGAAVGITLGHLVPSEALVGVGAMLILFGSIVLVWNVDPAWTMSAAIALSLFGGHWQYMGLPTSTSPERVLLVLVVVMVIMRAPVTQGRPRMPLGLAHLLLLAAGLIAIVSAAAVGTLFNKADFFLLVDKFGLLPFAAYAVAPVVFSTPQQRRILLVTLALVGAYLGATAVFEIAGPRSAVYPKYILDPAFTIHEGRARGPFVESTLDGFGIYVGGLAATVIAATTRRREIRIIAVGIAVLCTIGVVLTLTRSVWLSAAVATTATAIAVREARRWFPVAAIVATVITAVTLATVPGLAVKASSRLNQAQTVYERESLLTASIRMVEARPLFGFGWATFETASEPYYIVGAGPTKLIHAEPVHNVYASNLAELGLIGTGAWLIAGAVALGGPLRRYASGEARLWRIMLGTTLTSWLCLAVAAPLYQIFPHLVVWTLGGVYTGCLLSGGSAAPGRPGVGGGGSPMPPDPVTRGASEALPIFRGPR
jgi:putative inorganic carbon (hco3(-)) transporter